MERLTNKQFDNIYEKHADAIFRYFLLRVKDRERAIDFTQEVFLKTWEYGQNNKIDNEQAFLFRVAHNIYVNDVRTYGRTVSLETYLDTGFHPESGDHKSMIISLEAKRILIESEKLGDEYRDVIHFRYVEDLPVKDIAEIVGVSENVISVRLNRAKTMLQQKIKIDNEK
jgi:RNA polymerase sigma factor (sigma-70 family)